MLLTSIFNMKITIEHTGYTICPVKGLTVVGKEIIKISFIFAIFVIIIVLLISSYCYNCFLRKTIRIASEKEDVVYNTRYTEYTDGNATPDDAVSTHEYIPFNTRVQCFFLKMIILAYLPVSVFVFNFLNCYNINGIKVLYIQGNVICYNTWQKLIFAVAVIWIAPFCGTLYIASNLLQSNKVQSSQFIRMVMFPPSVIFYYIYSRVYVAEPRLPSEQIMARHILSNMYKSFRRRKSDNTYLMWQCVLHFRKLTIVIAYTFIDHPVGKLYTIVFLLIIFLQLHYQVIPYSCQVLNDIESYSLLALILLGVLNTYWAIGYMTDITTSTHFQIIAKIILYMEITLRLSPICIILFAVVYSLWKRIKCWKTSCGKVD